MADRAGTFPQAGLGLLAFQRSQGSIHYWLEGMKQGGS